ncbi:MAG: FtsQ-type POTRA domain-containing protein [Anaerolineales bacterium]|nr:FtsQ-type POTRA domain-containing protein [Anaerolineales bacterium]
MAERQRLRKQPKMRRAQTAVSMPRLEIPKTARQRRRRTRQQWVRQPMSLLRAILFSARWVSLGLLALSVYALYLIGMDEQFYVTFIPVEGAHTIPAEEVVAASGLAGTHVFAVDPNAAAAQINELPGIIGASVAMNWPNDVTIQVTEDSPVALWRENGTDFWVNRQGSLIPARMGNMGLLQIVSEMVPAAAPVVAEGEGQVEEETAVSTPTTSLPFIPTDVLNGALQLRELRPNIEQLYYRPAGGLSFQDGRGWRVYFGSGSNMQQKLVVYETIVEDLVARGITPLEISVSNQEKPFYRVP